MGAGQGARSLLYGSIQYFLRVAAGNCIGKPIGISAQMKILTDERMAEKLQRGKTRRAGAIMLLWLAIPVAAGLVGTGSVQAQDEPVEVTLDLGMGQGTPGASVVIQATLRVADDTDVGAIEIRVEFPNSLVTFQEARKAIGAEASNAEVTATVEEVENDVEKSVAVIAVTPEPGMWFPTGTVVDLVFKVDEEAPLEAAATLEPQLQAETAGDSPRPILAIGLDDGVIFVGETTLVFSCFFYMH